MCENPDDNTRGLVIQPLLDEQDEAKRQEFATSTTITPSPTTSDK